MLKRVMVTVTLAIVLVSAVATMASAQVNGDLPILPMRTMRAYR